MIANNQRKIHRRLTVKQKRFIDFYTGNAAEAARLAGYSGNDDTLKQVGAENLTKPYIVKAIQEREKQRNQADIANREERQRFWTDGMRDEKAKMSDRAKHSELLGRSEGDFLDRTKHEGGGVRVIGLEEALDAAEKDETPLIKEQ
jgi:phage terminase small subunit